MANDDSIEHHNCDPYGEKMAKTGIRGGEDLTSSSLCTLPSHTTAKAAPLCTTDILLTRPIRFSNSEMNEL